MHTCRLTNIHIDNFAPGGSRTRSCPVRWILLIRYRIALYFLVLTNQFFWNTPAFAAPSVPAPDFQIKTFNGDLYSKTSLQGRPTLLVFWAPWCRYCRMELPLLAEFYQGNKPAQLQVLTIAFSDTRAHVEEYVTSNPETFVFPTAFDQGNDVARAFGVNATPTFVVMDAQGKMILAHLGAGINRNPQYQEFLKHLK